MPVMPEDFAPYAPARNVLLVVHQFRERGLPEVITSSVLDKLGIPEGNIGRVSQTLRFLGLTDDEGRRTDVFEAVRQASTEQYPEIFAQIVRNAYHAVFQYVDPAVDTDIRIADQFRHFQPQSVRSRMVALFMELCHEGGIGREDAVFNTGNGNPSKPRVRRKSASAVNANTKEPKQNKEHPKQTESLSLFPEDDSATNRVNKSYDPPYHMLHAWLDQLPPDAKMTAELYDKWFTALTGLLGYTVKIIPEKSVLHESPQEQLA